MFVCFRRPDRLAPEGALDTGRQHMGVTAIAALGFRLSAGLDRSKLYLVSSRNLTR